MKTEQVFIVGCPRTGKTLLGEVLNQSAQVCIAEETQFLRRFATVGKNKRISQIGNMAEDQHVEQLVDALYAGSHAPPYSIWLRRNVDKQYLVRRFLETDRSERAFFLTMMQTYARLTTGANETPILGEETPTHLYYVPTLLQWFPQANIIHLLRNPAAIFVEYLKEIKMGYGGLQVKFPTAPNWLLSPLVAPVEVLHVSKLWLDAVKLHQQYLKQYPQQYRLFTFEALVANPAAQVQQICQFLNIPFESAMLNGAALAAPNFKQNINAWQTETGAATRLWFALIAKKYAYIANSQ